MSTPALIPGKLDSVAAAAAIPKTALSVIFSVTAAGTVVITDRHGTATTLHFENGTYEFVLEGVASVAAGTATLTGNIGYKEVSDRP